MSRWLASVSPLFLHLSIGFLGLGLLSACSRLPDPCPPLCVDLQRTATPTLTPTATSSATLPPTFSPTPTRTTAASASATSPSTTPQGPSSGTSTPSAPTGTPQGSRTVQPSGTPSPTSTSRTTATPSATVQTTATVWPTTPPGGVQIRSWQRPAGPGQRVRLAADARQRLQVAWMQRLVARQFRATLETATGQVLEQRNIQTTIAEFHPAFAIEGSLLVRDADRLLLAGALMGQGAYEAYAAIPGAIVAWAPCTSGPCLAEVLYQGPQGATKRSWDRILFGVDLTPITPGTLALATRELPAKTGWTLRTLDEAVLRTDGKILERAPAQVWSPDRGLSLEDPLLVRGANPPQIVGTAYQLPGHGKPEGPTGRVFLAEAGQPLQEILQVAATNGNAEIGAALHNGQLHLTAEGDPGHSVVYQWTPQGPQELLRRPGAAPHLASAEGALWLSTTAGLWKVR